MTEREMIAEDPDMRGRVSVTYRRDPSLGMWLPSQMTEFYESLAPLRRSTNASPLRLEGHASYSNFRRFRVTTEERIRK